MNLKELFNRANEVIHSRQGHSVLVFMAFLALSALLWCVIAFNDESQADIRMPVRLTNVPDSVTIVSQVPATMSVSLQARGTQLLKLTWGKVPNFNIDFRVFRSDGALRLTDTDLKAIARSAIDGANIIIVSPDSLNLAFTSQPPVVMPVNPDYIVTPGPQATISGTPRLSADSVKVYSIGRLPSSIEAITTEPIRFNSLNETTTKRVKLIAPPGSRVIPDSIDVTIDVEPLIFKTRKVAVEAINVPEGQKLITFPAQVDVMYMIPVSDYKTSEPRIRVTADYRSISASSSSRMIRLRIAEASDNLQNVHLAVDSAEYIIEKLEKEE